MKTYALIGNCQARGLARCLQFFEPDARIDVIEIWEIAKRFESRKRCLAHLRNFDVVFLHRFGNETWKEIDSTTIAETVARPIYYPTVLFPAYHPDIVYVLHKKTWSVVRTPMTDYNSALALFGYLKGYPVERTVALFDRSTFRRLGYLDLWKTSVDELLRSPEAVDYKLGNRVLSWSRRGCFMHSSVHPKIGALADIARTMLTLAGSDVRDEDALTFVRDDLMDAAVWPLYPAIAERYGLSGGGYTFKRNTYDPDKSWPEWMTLSQFVQASYSCYERIGREQIECSRVQKWISDNTL